MKIYDGEICAGDSTAVICKFVTVGAPMVCAEVITHDGECGVRF